MHITEKDSVLHALMQAYQLSINTESLLKREIPRMDSDTRMIAGDCITSLNQIQDRLLEAGCIQGLAPSEVETGAKEEK